MKKTFLIASFLAMAGITLGIMAATQPQKATIKNTIARILGLRTAYNSYVADLIAHNILSSPAAQSNPFTIAHEASQTKSVVTSYYKAAWNTYDAKQKLNLRPKNQETAAITLVTATTGLTEERVNALMQHSASMVRDLTSSLKMLLKDLSIEGLAAILSSTPYLFFVELGIPPLALAPIILGTQWTANFTKKVLYNNKNYKDLRPLFDLCDQRIANDWKVWNTDADVQKKWLGHALWE